MPFNWAKMSSLLCRRRWLGTSLHTIYGVGLIPFSLRDFGWLVTQIHSSFVVNCGELFTNTSYSESSIRSVILGCLFSQRLLASFLSCPVRLPSTTFFLNKIFLTWSFCVEWISGEKLSINLYALMPSSCPLLVLWKILLLERKKGVASTELFPNGGVLWHTRLQHQ